MKNSSLGVEPPSKFDGKKEVYGKKNKPFSSLIVSLEDNKSKNRTIDPAKSIEKKVIFESQMYNLNINYLKNGEGVVERNSTATNKSVEFTKIFNTNFNKIISNFHYGQTTNDIEFTEKGVSKFYDINLPYSFIPQIKKENKEDYLSAQPKEQETKEILYTLYNFDEKAKQEK